MKPRKINRWDPSTWPVTSVIEAGRRGTKAEVEYFGDVLLKVRYRKAGGRIVKTAEIILGRPASVGKKSHR